MNSEQLEHSKTHLEALRAANVDQKLSESYGIGHDPDTTLIGNYTINQFSLFTKRIIETLDSALNNNELAAILPYRYGFNNEYGDGALNSDLNGLAATITNNDFSSALGFLYRLNYYLVANNLWNTAAAYKNLKDSQLREIENRIQVLSEAVDKSLTQVRSLIESLESEKIAVRDFLYTKTLEVEQISSLLGTARNNQEEINRLLISSTEHNSQILAVLSSQKEKFDQANVDIKHIEDIKQQFDANLGQFNSLLTTVTNKSSHFEDRLKVLDELIGKEGAHQLFRTFRDRKEELKKPVRNWSYAVMITGVISFLLVIAIFTNYKGWFGEVPTVIGWHFLLITSLKALPVVMVFLFTIKQYTRERNFREEYAFRSAIALTIQAYSDIAGSKKEDLIFKAVSNIYQTPSALKDKAGLFSFRTKGVNETLKEVNEMVKSIKEK